MKSFITYCSLILFVLSCLAGCSNGESVDTDPVIILPPQDSIIHVPDTVPNTPTDTIPQEPISPRLLTMTFKSADNPRHITVDVECEIIGDSIVECWLPGMQQDKLLVPSFTFEGDSIISGDMTIKSSETKADFSKPYDMSVISGYKIRKYCVYVHAYTGLPILWIVTKGNQEITSKDEYLDAHMRLVEDVVTRSPGEQFETDLQIKGRGNTTWGENAQKKPYRLKLPEKASLLDEPKDKAWILLANYFDKTMLRNQTAFFMSKISQLDYTPRYHFVDLILNGEYNGTYQLGEKIKISKNRVNVGDDGILLEVDYRADGNACFSTQHTNPIVIKEPEVCTGDENYNYIKDSVLKAERSLYASNFTDQENGWSNYFDMDSFVDWYLINEIAKNNDAVMFSSCFMHFEKGGKLKMGPVWDFDIGFGGTTMNDSDNPEGFRIKNAAWFSRMFQDPAFTDRVKERFAYFYSRRQDILNEIDQNASYLRYSVEENNKKWNTLKTDNAWPRYQTKVQDLKDWISIRFEWLYKAINEL